MVAEKPTNFALPDLRIAVGRLLEFLALDEVHRGVEAMLVAEAVDEEQVNLIDAQGREPLVEHRQHVLRGPWDCPW